MLVFVPAGGCGLDMSLDVDCVPKGLRVKGLVPMVVLLAGGGTLVVGP